MKYLSKKSVFGILGNLGRYLSTEKVLLPGDKFFVSAGEEVKFPSK